MIWLLTGCVAPPVMTPSDPERLPAPPVPQAPPQQTVSGSPQAVIAAEGTTGALPLLVHFDGGASLGLGLSFSWELDGEPVGTGSTYAHTWLGSGDSVVALTVTDEDGARATAEQQVRVVPAQCPTTGLQDVPGQVAYAALHEISGIGHSRHNPGVLWVHNDTSTGTPRQLHALDETGALLGEFPFDNDHGDWEDMAVGTDVTGAPILYVGSFGNNSFDRTFLSILIVDEPVVPLGHRIDAELPFREMEFEYPSGSYNSEALMFDPQTGALLVLTKSGSGRSHLFSAAAPHDEDVVELEELAIIDFGGPPLSGGTVTGASISPLGDQIVVRTYAETAYVFLRDASFPLVDALTTSTPCPIDLRGESQGEAIDFSLDGGALITISEGHTPPVNRTFLN